METPKIAIIGATGLVGQTLLSLMGEKDFFHKFILKDKLLLVASDNSVKNKLKCDVLNHQIQVITLEEALKEKPDIVIMSAGEKISAEWAIKFRNANKDSWVIDNSPQWRMKDHIPLTLPHLNWSPNKKHRIIPVPNCVAVMLATALYPLTKEDLKLYYVSATVMQSVSGTGNTGIDAWEKELENGGNKKAKDSPYLFQSLGNIQQATRVKEGENYNDEEKKVIAEMQKLFYPNFQKFPISPSCFRDGVKVGHWARVRVKMPLRATLKRVKGALSMGSIVKYTDKPTDILSVVGKNYALVYDLRVDEHAGDANYAWYEFTVVSDNLRLGAASTALLCAEKIIKKFYK